MEQYVKDCLTPLYILQCNKGLIDLETANSIMLYILYTDNRLMLNDL